LGLDASATKSWGIKAQIKKLNVQEIFGAKSVKTGEWKAAVFWAGVFKIFSVGQIKIWRQKKVFHPELGFRVTRINYESNGQNFLMPVKIA
jgi:hypothetical protein